MTQVDDARRQARICREMARQISLLEDRERLLRMAHEWDRFAARHEAAAPADATSGQRLAGRKKISS